ncbi:MAG: hypothetical protein ACI8UX_001679, partial [Psychromonas sp.]
ERKDFLNASAIHKGTFAISGCSDLLLIRQIQSQKFYSLIID